MTKSSGLISWLGLTPPRWLNNPSRGQRWIFAVFFYGVIVSGAVIGGKTLAQDGLRVGNQSTVVGQVPPNSVIGDQTVVIGPTEGTNTILRSGAYGHCAYATPGSLAVGAHAMAGMNPSAACK